MDILRKSGNKPALEGHDLPDEWTGFMNMRQLHRGDRLTEKLLRDQASQAEYRRGIDSLIQGLGTCCRNQMASGLFKNAQNGFALRLTFLISATSRAMTSTGRSIS